MHKKIILDQNNRNRIIGIFGEDIATDYLIKKGYRILLRNWRRKSDEIDIIAIDNRFTLVFIEVKTLILNNINNISPEDNLSRFKLHKISRAAEYFARLNNHLINEDVGWRMDLIAIDLGINNKPKDIRHYENISF